MTLGHVRDLITARSLTLCAGIVALAGCHSASDSLNESQQAQSPLKEYRDEEARLLTVRACVFDLRNASANPDAFAERVADGRTLAAEYKIMLDGTISSADAFSRRYPDNKHAETVDQILRLAREVEAMRAAGPSEELTRKVDLMHELAEPLRMRPMTAEEEAGIVRTIKRERS